MKSHRTTYVLMLAGLLLTFAACIGKSDKNTATQSQNESGLNHASILHMENKRGYTKVEVDNPWKPGSQLATYIIVPRDSALPADLPQGTLIRTPITKAVVYSAVHTSLFAELGAFNAVRGVCDSRFFTDSLVTQGLKNGTITDCGTSTAPNIEQMIALNPDAIFLSPFQESNYGQVTKIGAPLIYCADYMETSPLGRAEWMKFYALLLGKGHQATMLFEQIQQRYSELKSLVQNVVDKPSVLTETMYGNVWNIPGGRSYMARMIADAGGNYLWAHDQSTGSLMLSFEQVLSRAQHADVWLVKSFSINNYQDLSSNHPLNSRFDAFGKHNVWLCNTLTSGIFETSPFHPDRLLADYIAIFHPNIAQSNHISPRYYHKL